MSCRLKQTRDVSLYTEKFLNTIGGESKIFHVKTKFKQYTCTNLVIPEGARKKKHQPKEVDHAHETQWKDVRSAKLKAWKQNTSLDTYTPLSPPTTSTK